MPILFICLYEIQEKDVSVWYSVLGYAVIAQ